MNARLVLVALLWGTVAVAQRPEAPALNDAQIAHIVVTANQVDIDAGKLARTKAKAREVKDFGDLMIQDHTAVNAQAIALAKRLGLRTEDNPVSRSLHQGGRDNLAALRGLNHGAAFDRAYVTHEVAYHEAVLDALDKSLIPNAQSAELRDLLGKVRPAFAAHLDHARHVQANLPP